MGHKSNWEYWSICTIWNFISYFISRMNNPTICQIHNWYIRLRTDTVIIKKRSFDVDDLLLNLVGYIIGYGSYRMVAIFMNGKKGDFV